MQQIRRQLKFVRLLHRGGAAQKYGHLVRVIDKTQKASLDSQAVAALVSQGVLRQQNDRLLTTSEAPHWMRRQKLMLADLQQTTGSPTYKSTKNLDLPLVGNGQLNRLCDRKSVGGGRLTPDHILVANRLEHLIERAMLTPQITRNYEQLSLSLGQSRGYGSADISDMAADARKQLAQLYQLLPTDCMNVLVDICGFAKGLQEIEASRNWPRRSAKLVVKIGLDQLGAIWGIGDLAPQGRMRGNGK
ncbi:DUF6456 domain-containing protein [Maritalea mediterranea]|uniref:DUF6456 domain-containing protein n=1 Tax=Maritalea mediterranea TaxID=2909667 RepID=A0ABS9E4W2_9HYPH|nr:DUF6456 domain-containing protein [Maritalea mediterranea]MCF4097913.1 DUF6456 domain-containing protein [Maritalea mediterranea]